MALRIEDAVHGLMGVTARMVSLLAWMLVLLVHLALLVLALAAMWYWQVPPSEVTRWVLSLVPKTFASTAGGILGFLGLSAGAALWAYAKAWQWLRAARLLPWSRRGPVAD